MWQTFHFSISKCAQGRWNRFTYAQPESPEELALDSLPERSVAMIAERVHHLVSPLTDKVTLNTLLLHSCIHSNQNCDILKLISLDHENSNRNKSFESVKQVPLFRDEATVTA